MKKVESLIKIAQIISNNDDDIIAEVSECINNIEIYAKEHIEEFEERNVAIKYDTPEDLQWLSLINILVRNNYVMQIQENCTITDFGWNLYSLRTFKEYGLALDSKFIEEDYTLDLYDYNEDDAYEYYDKEDIIGDEGVVSWCKYLDNKWFDEDICLGMFGIGEDIFTLFLISEDELAELEDLADNLGKFISSVY